VTERARDVLIVIPARGGSKRLPGKNLLRIGGVTLVGRSVMSAREFLSMTGSPNGRIVVDTDSEEIASEGREWGAEIPFLRPPHLAADKTSSEATLRHLFERLGWSGPVILLQPTSPLRNADDIAECWNSFEKAGKTSVSITGLAHASSGVFTLGKNDEISRATGDGGEVYRLTGAVYVFDSARIKGDQTILSTGAVGVRIAAERSIDVDTPADFQEAVGALQSSGVKQITVDGKRIGGGAPVYVIAEAGVNHNGDPKLAHRLVDLAAESGADAVKFQTFEPELLASEAARKADYQVTNTGEASSQLAMLKTLVLPHSVIRELADHARELGITFLSTPFDERSADFLEQLGMTAFKVPSGEITNYRFLVHLARFGKPLLISSGMSTMPEVADALLAVKSAGAPPVALFHAVTEYPAPFEECNLNAIVSMRQTFGVPVGWSDHTKGIIAPIAAVALGAAIVEKHFTTSRELPGPDHPAALEPDELNEMVAAIRAVEAALGDGVKRPAESEKGNIPIVRRSLHTAKALNAGHTLTDEDLVALRPAGGFPPADWNSIVGRKLRTALPAGVLLEKNHFA
jgi:N-acetylneuraminate synthase